MNKIAVTMFNLLAILTAVIGAAFLGSQLQSDDDVVWHIPLILIGCGAGIHIFFNFALPIFGGESEEDDQLAQYADTSNSDDNESSFSDGGETD